MTAEQAGNELAWMVGRTSGYDPADDTPPPAGIFLNRAGDARINDLVQHASASPVSVAVYRRKSGRILQNRCEIAGIATTGLALGPASTVALVAFRAIFGDVMETDFDIPRPTRTIRGSNHEGNSYRLTRAGGPNPA
jgi:hypothetical protein